MKTDSFKEKQPFADVLQKDVFKNVSTFTRKHLCLSFFLRIKWRFAFATSYVVLGYDALSRLFYLI